MFLEPVRGGFPAARVTNACFASTKTLMDQPGVYEFATVKPGIHKRYKVYIGQSSSLRRRHNQEYRGPQGSHLRPFFDEALKNGWQIWRRHVYLSTPDEARAKELAFLRLHDFAWNVRQAGCAARHIDVRTTCCCCCRSVKLVARPLTTLPAAVAVNAASTI